MSQVPKQTILLSVIVAFLSTGLSLIFPILPEYLATFGKGTFEFGLSSSIYALAGLVAAIPIGYLADRFGKKFVILVDLFGYSVVNFLFIFAPTFKVFLILRAIEGVFGTTIMPPAIALVSDFTSEEERGKNIAIVSAGLSFGIIAGPVFGGVLLEYYGVYAPFYFSGFFGALGFIVAYFSIINLNPPGSEKLGKKVVENLRDILSSIPRPFYAFLFLLLITFANTVAWMMIEPGFIYYFYDGLNYSSIQFGIFVALYGGFVFVGEIFLGGLSDRYGRIRVVFVGSVVHVIFYYMLSIATNINLLYASAAVAGVALGLIGPALNALISEVAHPDYRTVVFGIINAMSSMAVIIGPFFGGWYLQQSGQTIQELIVLSVVVVGIATILVPFLRFRKSTMTR